MPFLLQSFVDLVRISLINGQMHQNELEQARKMEDLNKQKIMFFQSISHELRSRNFFIFRLFILDCEFNPNSLSHIFVAPLTLMLSPLEDVIAVCAPDSPIINNLYMIQRNSRRLLKLVDTLLQVKYMFIIY